jgi:hypothetical protein
MFKRSMLVGALAVAAPAVAVLVLAGGASAASTNVAQNLHFGASSDGASAHWSEGVGSPIDLSIGTTPGSWAVITLQHLSAIAVSALSEPTFSTDNYNAGSPRYYLTLSDGNSLWGYPSNAGLNGSDFAWAINNGNSYLPWSTVQTDEANATVTAAWVIMDADQAPGTTDVITNLTFGNNTYN